MNPLWIAVTIVVLVAAILLFRGFRGKGKREEDPLVSLVFFLEKARGLTHEAVRQAAARAFDLSFDSDDEDAQDFVIPMPPPPLAGVPEDVVTSFMLKTQGETFLINDVSRPYMENPAEASETVKDGRLRHILVEHQAWLSVDAFHPSSERPDKIYGIIGLMMAELAGPDCLGIYSPELQRFNEFDEELLEVLRSGSPLSLFELPTFAPIVSIDEDDPRMAQAVEEARWRWLEFVDAFEKNEDKDRPFLVKARFREGEDCEYMWMSVSSITQDEIKGRLENKPMSLTQIKEGDAVEVALSDLNDWLFPIDQESVGGFTLKVLQDQQQQ